MGLSPSRGSWLTNRGVGLRGVSVDDGMRMFQRWMMELIYWMRLAKSMFCEGVVVLYSAILLCVCYSDLAGFASFAH